MRAKVFYDLPTLCFVPRKAKFLALLCVSATWQEVVSMIFMFSKIANFVLFARSDLRLGLIYLIFCLGKYIS